ncbi:hypothetical protein BDV95DRAFT_604710 [Massariosphaeria phaeospora]|uniref:BZIP domain-containing protein n=1 Tax=Massariosphaeria phaeospora TaxID=100035 RepID=A0A7C8M9I3_9PLEO|nr:hypothetical protein BDV95DRAFT_604710 [Massariosphaeria phaeospora]
MDRKTKTPKKVPEPGDPDRKRVLNVLAQRRYRQRRRERIAELEAQAKRITPPQTIAQPRDRSVDVDFEVFPTTEPSSEELDEVEEVDRNDFVDVGFGGFQDLPDFQLFQDSGFSYLPSPIPQSPSSAMSISSSNTSAAPPGFNFPISADGGLLSIPMLSALHAFTTIATNLDIMAHIYNPLYLHTVSPKPDHSLPPSFYPTPAQIAIPHHPLIDTLVWPSVREKLICMLALPSAVRPPIARDDDGDGQSKAVIQLMHDLDDVDEGLKVHGNTTTWNDGSELAPESWEVGEQFFRNWWWCLDTKILELTNRKRKERGQSALRIQG